MGKRHSRHIQPGQASDRAVHPFKGFIAQDRSNLRSVSQKTIVLIHDQRLAGFFEGADHRRLVQGIQGANVDHLALNTILIGYTPYAGEIAGRPSGVLVADRPGKAVAYAIFHLQPRGTIFVKPNDPVYRGLIVGENTRPDDMIVNITKEKKQTNIRAANTDEALRLVPPRQFGLEQAMEFINDDELVEVTPTSIRRGNIA